jgi:hypothetical protein
MPTDREYFRQWQKGQLNAAPIAGDTLADQANNLETLANQVNQRVAFVAKPAVDAATGTAHYLPFLVADRAIRIISAKVLPAATTNTGGTNASNYATISLIYNDGAGGANTTVGSVGTNATALTVGVPASVSLNASNVDIASGKMLAIAHTKTSDGVVVGAYTVAIVYQEI